MGETAETGETGTTWAQRATPPPVRVLLDLQAWRPFLGPDPTGASEAWAIPVPAPFRLEGSGRTLMLVGSAGVPGAIFRPALAPGLYGDFADIAGGIKQIPSSPSEETQGRMLDFVNRHGLPVAWTRDEGASLEPLPPRRQAVRHLLGQAVSMRKNLETWRSAKRDAASIADSIADLREMVEMPMGGGHLLAGFGAKESDVDLSYGWDFPPPLMLVMQLQAASDLLDGRNVNQCRYCGKLFVWTDIQERQRDVRRRVYFCSVLHARAYAQQKRRRRQGDPSGPGKAKEAK